MKRIFGAMTDIDKDDIIGDVDAILGAGAIGYLKTGT
jgi:hypothetical protein